MKNPFVDGVSLADGSGVAAPRDSILGILVISSLALMK
jgi:hypothetical protein